MVVNYLKIAPRGVQSLSAHRAVAEPRSSPGLTPLLIRMEACVRRLSQKESKLYYTPDPVSAIVSGDCRLRSERGRTSNDRAGSLRRVGMLCGQRRTGQAIEKSAACDCTCVMVLSFPQRLGSADAKMIAPSLLAEQLSDCQPGDSVILGQTNRNAHPGIERRKGAPDINVPRRQRCCYRLMWTT